MSQILDPKEMGNLKGILRVHCEEMDVLDGDDEKNAVLRFLTSGRGTFKGRLLFQNMADCINNTDIYVETNTLPTGIVEDTSERRTRGAICNDVTDGDLDYFEKLMSEIQPEGEGTPYNPNFMYALSTVLYYEPLDTTYKPRAKPRINKFKHLLLFTAENGDEYYKFAELYINQLLEGITAKHFDELVENYLERHPFKVRKGKKEQVVKKQTFKTTFGLFVLKSRKIRADELAQHKDVKKDTLFYEFDNIEDTKKFLDPETYQTLVESQREPAIETESETSEEHNKRIDDEIERMLAAIEELKKQRK